MCPRNSRKCWPGFGTTCSMCLWPGIQDNEQMRRGWLLAVCCQPSAVSGMRQAVGGQRQADKDNA